MLQRLSIKNFALIDNIDIQFDEKLNILTGETGAGKSIIIGALSLLLGQRSDNKYFFNQQKKCIIEGQFSIHSLALTDFFNDHDLDHDDETILRREISNDGKSRAFVNDTPVNLTTLKNLGEKLIDIHSQHATLEINDAAFQMMALDSVANHQALISQYHKNYKEYKNLLKKIEALKVIKENSLTELDYVQYLFDELENVQLKLGEQISLEKEISVLTHAEEIKKNLLSSDFLLNTQEQSVLSTTKAILQLLQSTEKYYPKATELYERLNSCYFELKDISNEVTALEETIFYDQNRIIAINERLNILYPLINKHHVLSSDDLIDVQESFSSKLASINHNDEELIKLESELVKQKKLLEDLASKISQNRKKAIPTIEKYVVDNLKEMGMSAAQFKLIQDIDADFDYNGFDRVKFMFSANAGQSLNVLNKVASGGELSRLMLAIKSLIAQKTSLATIIFDEIDTGISGEVANKVGKIMDSLSENMQVITITHLPQIAVKGDTHLFVYKENLNATSQTKLRKLTQQDREIEIAKMLSGENFSDAALLNARELLNQ